MVRLGGDREGVAPARYSGSLPSPTPLSMEVSCTNANIWSLTDTVASEGLAPYRVKAAAVKNRQTTRHVSVFLIIPVLLYERYAGSTRRLSFSSSGVGSTRRLLAVSSKAGRGTRCRSPMAGNRSSHSNKRNGRLTRGTLSNNFDPVDSQIRKVIQGGSSGKD
jgi:hypothetical protein